MTDSTTDRVESVLEFEFWGDYIARQSWHVRGVYSVADPITSLANQEPRLLVPVNYPEQRSDLMALGALAGFTSPDMQATLTSHNRVFRRAHLIRIAFYLLFAMPALVGLTIAPLWIGDASESITSNHLGAFFISCSFFLVIMFLMMLWLAFALRLASFISARWSANILCVGTAIEIAAALKMDTALDHLQHRRAVLRTVDFLATYTRLLPLRFHSRDAETQTWFQTHTRHIERYIRERERWIQAPTATTREMLYADFRDLARMYITGNYGEFTWPEAEATPTTHPATTRQRARAVVRFAGFILPLAIMLGLLIEQNRLEVWGIAPAGVGALAMTWLMLGIDVALNLGIVSGLANLLKEMRELT